MNSIAVGPLAFKLCDGPTPKMTQEEAEAQWGPHASNYINIYMNEGAARAFASCKDYPVGAVVVKEKQVMRGVGSRMEPAGVGGMVKRAPGYDSKNGDWEYFYVDTGNQVSSGSLESCIACHRRVSARDYVFGDWAEGAQPRAPEVPTVRWVLTNYRELNRETPQPVPVSAELSLLCISPSQGLLDAERTRHGPHAFNSIEVFMNDLAHAAHSQTPRRYPVGSAIIKAKYSIPYLGDQVQAPEWAFAGMIKREAGYDSNNGDWEYFYYSASKELAQGKLQNCIDCHSGVSYTDFVFGDWGSERWKGIGRQSGD